MAHLLIVDDEAVIGGLLVFSAMAYPLVRGEVIGFDLPVRAAIHAEAFPALTAAMRLITSLGSEYFLVPLATIVGWCLVKRGERKKAYLLVGGILVLCFCGTALAGYVLGTILVSRGASLAAVQNEFLSSVSHELRTPLTSIRLFIDTLREDRVHDPAS